MKNLKIPGLVFLAAGSVGSVNAVVLFEDGFDSLAAADVTINQQADTEVAFVDYSNFTVGSTDFSIAEAPRQIGGSLSTRGILVRANLANGVAAAVNIVAGATPQAFTGDYRLSFDAYINVANPPPSGGTEQLLWGIGDGDASTAFGRNNRATEGSGVWGWLAGENGYGTEDTAIFSATAELADLGDTQPGESDPFNAAFVADFGGNGEPALQWVNVDIVTEGGNVTTYFNGVPFFSQAGLSTDGFAMLGYEDPFGSVSAGPDSQWGLFDNFLVTDDLTVIPEPSTGLLALLGGALALRRRRR